MTLGAWVKHEREARGWSQSELARRAGLSSVFVNLIEQGKRPKPSGETLQALARAFEIEVGAVYAAVRAGQPASPPALEDPRLADWPADMLARLGELYPDMSADELETAVELGVDAVRRIKDRRQHPQRQVPKRGQRPAPPGQEGSPPPEGGDPPDRISARGRQGRRLVV
jgi:transcriptional regulator with XRE-family HTH domain